MEKNGIFWGVKGEIDLPVLNTRKDPREGPEVVVVGGVERQPQLDKLVQELHSSRWDKERDNKLQPGSLLPSLDSPGMRRSTPRCLNNGLLYGEKYIMSYVGTISLLITMSNWGKHRNALLRYGNW